MPGSTPTQLSFDRKKIPFHKRALSYLKPVWLKNEVGYTNPHLELLLYKDRIQLATEDALYSDGEYYTPALSILDYLQPFLPQVKDMLILGVGLGSTVQIMEKRGYEPLFTLVELDKVVLKLALEFLASTTATKLNPYCEDAQVFMQGNQKKFDLIFIDIFDSREVPAFATSTDFLLKCKESLNPGGRLALNYIINDMMKWNETQIAFATVFPGYHLISSSINRIFITR